MSNGKPPWCANTRAEIAKLAPTSLALMIYMGISHLMPRGRYHANILYHLREQQTISSILEFPQNYPHQINLPHSVIHNFQKMPKI